MTTHIVRVAGHEIIDVCLYQGSEPAHGATVGGITHLALLGVA